MKTSQFWRSCFEPVPLRFLEPTVSDVMTQVGARTALLREVMLHRFGFPELPLEQRFRRDVVLVWMPSQGGKNSLREQASDFFSITVPETEGNLAQLHHFFHASTSPRLWVTRTPRDPIEATLSPEYHEFLSPSQGEERVQEFLFRSRYGLEQPHLAMDFYSGHWYGLSADEVRKAALNPYPILFSSCSLLLIFSLFLVFPGAHVRAVIPERLFNFIPETFVEPRPDQEDEDFLWRFQAAVSTVAYIMHNVGRVPVHSVRLLRHESAPDQEVKEAREAAEMSDVLVDLVELYRAMSDEPTSRLAARGLHGYQQRLAKYRKFVELTREVALEEATRKLSDTSLQPTWIRDAGLCTDWGERNAQYISPIAVHLHRA